MKESEKKQTEEHVSFPAPVYTLRENVSEETKKFIQDSGVAGLMALVREKYGITTGPDGKDDYSGVPVVSDIIDDEGHQYVDLVQKGGGVWGVALVGFTWVMEEMGIRFLRMAGTSAGSINTVLMTAIGKKNDKKSIFILDALLKKSLFDFVDGHWVVKLMVRVLISGPNAARKWMRRAQWYLITLLIALVGVLVSASHWSAWTPWFYGLGLVAGMAGLIGVSFVVLLWGRFNQSGLGLNPGDDFLNWLRTELKRAFGREENDKDVTSEELMAKATALKGLSLKHREGQDISDLKGDLIVITSELCTQNKIELPRMIPLFQRKSAPGINRNSLEGAATMVRASMAIPFFFESFYIKQIDNENAQVRKAWDDFFRILPPPECRLVDGGILSNFPVNVYVNPDIATPRFPTIGIDLYDSDDEKDKKLADRWSVGTFVMQVFNTARNFYDKDFIQKNSHLRKNIARVDLKKFNWLQFNMSEKDKMEMFRIGAEAAIRFLTSEDPAVRFDWAKYQSNRKEEFDIRQSKNAS